MDKLKDKLAKKLIINDIQVSSPHPNQDDFEVLAFIVYNLINEAVAEERERIVGEIEKLDVLWLSKKPDEKLVEKPKRKNFNQIGINKNQALTIILNNKFNQYK